jgi:hypothetical protein
MTEYVTLQDIAALLNVNPRTPHLWRWRSKTGQLNPPLPEPDGYHSRQGTPLPYWRKSVIIGWAKVSGRWPE